MINGVGPSPSAQPSCTPAVEQGGSNAAGQAGTPRMGGSVPAVVKGIHERRVEIVAQGPPRGAPQAQSAGPAVGRLMAGVRKFAERDSAVNSFAAELKGQRIDADYLKHCLPQMALLHDESIIDDGQFESIMTTLIQATDGDNMEATAKEFIQAAQQLPSCGAEGSGRELTLPALRALGRAVNAMPPGVADLAANAVADMTGRIQDKELANDLFTAFWSAATAAAPKSPEPENPAGVGDGKGQVSVDLKKTQNLSPDSVARQKSSRATATPTGDKSIDVELQNPRKYGEKLAKTNSDSMMGSILKQIAQTRHNGLDLMTKFLDGWSAARKEQEIPPNITARNMAFAISKSSSGELKQQLLTHVLAGLSADSQKEVRALFLEFEKRNPRS